jgi:hypothetical protein
MATGHCTCFVLDRESGRTVYRAKSIAQAQGFIDRRRKPSIIALSASTFAAQDRYQLAMVDSTSGQVISRGPVVNLFDAAELLCDLRLVILPVCETEVAL